MKRLTLLFVIALFAAFYPGSEMAFAQQAVSYTHLTLPTIYSV